jgi:hypothetical protein
LHSTITTGEVIITEEQQAGGGGGCNYKWNCTNWSECTQTEKQIRNCTNIGTCPDNYKTPEIEQNCTYAFEEEIIFKGTTEREIFIYFATILVVGLIILYLKRGYIKRLIKKKNSQ